MKGGDKMTLRATDLTYSALFVCLMAIGANITVWFPMLAIPIGGATVPLSLQTFFAIIAGLILGRKLGSLSMLVYMLVGVVGIPVFAGLKAGPMILISPTGGFIISFIFVAYFAGYIVEKCNKATFPIFTVAALCGLIVNYVFGVTYMYLAMNTWLNLDIAYHVAWIGMIPFIIKDTALAILAATLVVQIGKRISLKTVQSPL